MGDAVSRAHRARGGAVRCGARLRLALRSLQKRRETARITCASFSQRLSASEDLAFCDCRGSIPIASAQSAPAVGHACSALAMSAEAACAWPALRSMRTDSSHRQGSAGMRRRADSSSERALPSTPSDASSAAAPTHTSALSAQSLSART